MSLPGSTGRVHNVFFLSICLFVCYKSCEDDVLNMSLPISMQIGTICPWGQGYETVDLGANRSQEVKVTRSGS